MPSGNGSLIRICASDRPPFITLIKRDGCLVGVKGTTSSVLEYTARAVDQKYILIDTVVTLLGSKDEATGEWDGILGNVSRKECDLLLNPVTPTWDRSDATDFAPSHSYYSSCSVLSGPPQKLTLEGNALLRIFQNEVWIALAVSVVVVPFFGYLVDSLSKRLIGSTGRSLGVHYCRFFAAFLTQSQTFSCLSNASKVILTIWILSLFCLTSSYKGNVYSMITLPAKTEYIERIPDLIKYPKLRIFTPKNNYEENYLRLSEDKLFKRIWKQVLQTGGSVKITDINTPETMGEVLAGKAAIVSSDTRNRNTAALYCTPHTFLHVGDGIEDLGYSVPLRRNFPKDLGEKLSIAYLEYLASAHFQYHSKKDTVGARCLELPYITSRPDDPIKLVRILSSLVLWALGISTSAVALVVEILCRRLCSNKLSLDVNRITNRDSHMHSRRNKRITFLQEFRQSQTWERSDDIFRRIVVSK